MFEDWCLAERCGATEQLVVVWWPRSDLGMNRVSSFPDQTVSKKVNWNVTTVNINWDNNPNC